MTEPMSMDPAPASPTARGSRGLIAAVVTIALAAAAVATFMLLWDQPDARQAAATASPTGTSTSAAPVVDAAAVEACRRIDRYDAMADAPTFEEASAISEIATRSTDFNIRFSGTLLSDRADLAKAAWGKSDQAQHLIGLTTSAIELSTACIKARIPKG